MAKRGRPKGSVVPLLGDAGRFEIAAWFAFTELGFGVYPAAFLVAFLASDRPITTESIDGVLLKSSSLHQRSPSAVIGHADRIRRKAPEVIARAADQERAWLTASMTAIIALVTFAALGNAGGMVMALRVLHGAGWTETLDRIGKRMDATLRSNFPPTEGKLRGTARQLLRRQQQAKKSAA